MKIEDVLAKSISEAIAGSEELWGLVDEAISEMLSSEETEVEIWLERGHDRMAAVTVAAADDPVVVPFVFLPLALLLLLPVSFLLLPVLFCQSDSCYRACHQSRP